MQEYTLAQMQPGLSHSFQVSVTEAKLAAFRELSGDDNTLHVDRAFAQGRGFPDRVVYGMLTASFYSTLVGMYLPGKYALLQGVDSAFLAPVFVGDTLTIQGEVVAVHEAVAQIEIKAAITNQHGKKVSRAKIRAGVHE
jgi:3-hydroxybutyryl-CoA dehydratase